MSGRNTPHMNDAVEELACGLTTKPDEYGKTGIRMMLEAATILEGVGSDGGTNVHLASIYIESAGSLRMAAEGVFAAANDLPMGLWKEGSIPAFAKLPEIFQEAGDLLLQIAVRKVEFSEDVDALVADLAPRKHSPDGGPPPAGGIRELATALGNELVQGAREVAEYIQQTPELKQAMADMGRPVGGMPPL